MGGAISKFLGTNNNFQAAGTDQTQGRVDQTYGQTQDALAKQAQFANALAGANGIGNQSSVFNQLQNVAAGQGPNPAQAMLAQATGANTANQAALMAGQRGASANPALIARQAAMQGAANQQGAAGQAATMQANQSLGALNQMGGIAGQQVAAQGAATMGLNQAAQGAAQQQLGAQQAQNQINAGVAAQNAKAAGDIVGGITSGIGAAMGLAKGGAVPEPKVEATSEDFGQFPPENQDDKFGKDFKEVEPDKMAQGGVVEAIAHLHKRLDALENGHRMAEGGMAMPSNPFVDAVNSAPKMGPSLGGDPRDALTTGTNSATAGIFKQAGKLLSSSPTDGGGAGVNSPMGVSKGPVQMTAAAHGGQMTVGSKLKSGGHVPGQAKVAGDSLKNDNVHALLSPGEVVIPRSIAQAPDAPKKAADFVAAIMAKGAPPKKPKSKKK